MAEPPVQALVFSGGCPDCGERQVVLPPPLPDVGNDFDWRQRDYDGFRLAMLTELAARFPERTRWTPADLEVVLVEALAAVLDQLSDMLDRVTAEAYLETARRPESVRRLLSLIGFDAAARALDRGEIALDPRDDRTSPAGRAKARRRLVAFWLANPHAMDEARQAGPRAIRDQHRMVTVGDYALRLEEHPLVLRAHAVAGWSGSWTTVRVAVVAFDNRLIDGRPIPGKEPPEREILPYPKELRDAITAFHEDPRREIPLPPLDPPSSIRTILTRFVEVYRMAGQEVVLEDAVPVPVIFSLSVRVAANFFLSEVRSAVRDVLGTGAAGFFRPGRLRFGEDLHASDLVAAVMALDGVETVCLNRWKRLGNDFPDQVESGVIRLDGTEIAVCDNNPERRERGHYLLTLHGGLKG